LDTSPKRYAASGENRSQCQTGGGMACLRYLRFVVGSVVLLTAGCSGPGSLSSSAGLQEQVRVASRDELLEQAPLADVPFVSRSQQPDEPGISQTSKKETILPGPVAGPLDGRYTARIRAKVNGQPILDDEVRQSCYKDLLLSQNLPEPQRTAQCVKIINQELEHLIDREVILQEVFAKLKSNPKLLEKLKAAANKEFDKRVRAMKASIKATSDEQLKDFLRQHSMSLEGMRRHDERDFIAMEYMRSRITEICDWKVTHLAIRDYYEQHPNEFQIPDSVHWLDIFIAIGDKHPTRQDARRAAQEIAVMARAGEDFAKLSAKYDEGDSSYRHGEGYGHRRGEIKPPEVEDFLFKMREGDVGPLVEIPTGIHLFRLVKREYSGLLPFDEKVQAQIRSKLRGEVALRESKRIIKELRSRATIEVVRDAGP
jgi:parvulin-like peptidyl-prolyl isomerase